MLITADPRVDKSRLIAEMEMRARVAGGLLLVGGCVPVGDEELLYAPLCWSRLAPAVAAAHCPGVGGA